MTGKLMVAIDVAKNQHFALAEYPNGTRKQLKISNTKEGFEKFKKTFLRTDFEVTVALEPTADYHRCLCYFMLQEGIKVHFVNTVAMARIRDALNNSWNKSDPRDAQVILYMLKNDIVQIYYDPHFNGTESLQELSSQHFRLTRQKTKLQHSILNHFLPLYFPEAAKFFTGSKARWITGFLQHYPVPSYVNDLAVESFIDEAWDLLKWVPFRKKVLEDFYNTCKCSIGIPIEKGSTQALMFQEVLRDHSELNRRLRAMEKDFEAKLKSNRQYEIVRSVPGIGPVVALNVVAESGDIKRFRHSNQYVKYMGLNLVSAQSGTYQGERQISKRGNPRLRSILWQATKVAVYAHGQRNPFKQKYMSIVRSAPDDGHLKRKALTACSIKLARIIHTLVKKDITFRPMA